MSWNGLPDCPTIPVCVTQGAPRKELSDNRTVMNDTPHRNPFATLNLEPVSTVDRVAEELRRSLFAGELGPGTQLREVALAAALGVSRSTVREALGMLVAEGLAVRVPNRGTQVRRLDPEQVRDVCQARVVIETAGVRRWNEAAEPLREEVRRALQAFSDLTVTDYSAAEFTARRGPTRAGPCRPGPWQRHRTGPLARRPPLPAGEERPRRRCGRTGRTSSWCRGVDARSDRATRLTAPATTLPA
jgi:DNA-binding transcriptional regulator YhcF (GntR family)